VRRHAAVHRRGDECQEIEDLAFRRRVIFIVSTRGLQRAAGDETDPSRL
jgi:hypothetical protein